MGNVKLTDAMHHALCRIYSETVTHGHPWAYHVHYGSANALVRRGLAEVDTWWSFDREYQCYRLTAAGRAALVDSPEGQEGE